ncbi:MAG: hypothetical protein JW801_03400 [Bacteroidales bacterium]|nr:hypothetical protein [Bacteroidales bacterium]
MKIGILKETKTPPDRRVPFTPYQVRKLADNYPMHEFKVQSSPLRAYSDEEYQSAGIPVTEDVSDCDILMGVKEVTLDKLQAAKTYLFFSHTAKEQSHNQKLFQHLSRLECTLIDYEYLLENNVRVVAFGYWAGVIGAYNAILGYGLQHRNYELKPAHHCRNLAEMKEELGKVRADIPMKIVITGEGRVAGGASEILLSAGIKRIHPEEFPAWQGHEHVFCHTGPQHYTRHFSGKEFDFNDFIRHPSNYESSFSSYMNAANILIACHFWDVHSPHFFTPLDMQNPAFKIRLVSDISCDVPGPIPTTLRVSEMNTPFYGVHRFSCQEIEPFDPDQVTVSAVDNLPSALPRDASEDFGNALLKKVIPELLKEKPGEMIRRAMLLKKGRLTEPFSYLKDYLEGIRS